MNKTSVEVLRGTLVTYFTVSLDEACTSLLVSHLFTHQFQKRWPLPSDQSSDKRDTYKRTAGRREVEVVAPRAAQKLLPGTGG